MTPARQRLWKTMTLDQRMQTAQELIRGWRRYKNGDTNGLVVWAGKGPFLGIDLRLVPSGVEISLVKDADHEFVGFILSIINEK